MADERWLRRLLLRLAPHARVLAPSDLTPTSNPTAQATLSLYAAGGVTNPAKTRSTN